MITLLIPILLLASPTEEQGLPASPCRGVFEYETLGTEPGRWYGIIHLFTDTPLRSLWLNIELDSKAELLGNWIGEVTSKDNMNYKLENSQIMIKPGPPYDVRIFVQYNVLNRAPKLQSIKFNGREICNAGSLQPTFELPVQIEQTVRPQTSFTQSFIPSAQSTPMLAPAVPSAPIQGFQQPNEGNPSVIVKRPAQERCGRMINVNALVVQGTETRPGQWPWQIALYETKIADSKFICGGTLISHLHVITAAHCVTHEHSRRLKNTNSLIVFLGKHNLQTTTLGVQIRFVEQVTVNPNYDPVSYSHDISIIQLLETVSYSNRIQPACLWPENLIPLSNVVGKKGSLYQTFWRVRKALSEGSKLKGAMKWPDLGLAATAYKKTRVFNVVGWGFDITGVLTEELNLVEMQVVDTETCLRSKSDFYNRFTSNYSFCAGNNDGSSVCNGDSGGGMVFALDDGSWYLRGVVSLSVATPNDNRCNPNHYVIFTDVAKILPWIKSNSFSY